MCSSSPWVLQSQGGHHHHHHEEPEGHHLHGEQEGHHLHGVPEEESLDAVWKGLTALSGVYIMFLIEHFLTLGKMYKDKKQKVGEEIYTLLNIIVVLVVFLEVVIDV